MRIICFGDSITEGRSISDPPRPAEYVHALEARWPTILGNILRSKTRSPLEVLNKGVGGNTTKDALERLERDVLCNLPALVIIEFGFNDALFLEGWTRPNLSEHEFLHNLGIIIAEIRKRSDLPVCLVINHPTEFIHPQENKKSLEENLRAYHQQILKFRDTEGVYLLDIGAEWQAYRSGKRLFSWDGLHLTEEGNHHYAAVVASLLERLHATLSDSWRCDNVS